MKNIFSILFFVVFFTQSLLSKDVDSIALFKDSLPFNLSEHYFWKYNQYDSVVFNQPLYNDNHWKKMKTTLYFDDDGNLDFNGLTWFRFTIFVDSELVNMPMAIELNHCGASEIYLDGKLIEKFGEINTSGNSVYYDPLHIPIVFNFYESGKHILAIRYANYNARLNLENYNESMAGFEIKIGKASSTIYTKHVNDIAIASIFMLLAGFFFSFSLIHFFMFILNRSIKSNLYFSLFMFFLAACFTLGLTSFTISNVEWQLKFSSYFNLFTIFFFTTLSGFTNELFSEKKKRFLFITALAMVAIYFQYNQHHLYENFMMFFVVIILLEAIYLVVKAIQQKIGGAWIIGTGILFFTLFILLALIFSFVSSGGVIVESSSMIGNIIILCVILTIVSIPLSMSIYLAWNFSTINKNLSLQLEQVKVLSQKNIEQEKEKQRILENKKEELETQVLERTAELRQEKKKSDDLLLNILPAEIAEELKEKGSAVARDYDKVTVMFTDFKDFTKISELLTPSELVKEIDLCFSAFDRIIQKRNIEKIKTIGDAYMCVGGLPIPSKTHAHDVVNAALEIRDFMEKHNQEKAIKGEPQFRIRIGIHTGAVVAGIVGVKKFAYDIWGDTVNIASRIESSGEPNKVNISGTTFELVKDKFKCQHRGKIEAKNKGEIDMYFVERA
jgi:class 3 adenylate cyclase